MRPFPVALLEDRRVEVTNRGCRFQTGVKAGRRTYRTMCKHPSNDLVLAGIGVEVKLGAGMTKQMRVHLHSGVAMDGFADLIAERVERL